MLAALVRAYLRLLKNRPFATLWAGSTVSLMGDALTWVALVWIVLDLTGSAADVGLLVIAYTAPVLIGGFVMGSALDRFDRRRLLIAVNAVLGCIVLSVPVASAFHALAIWQLYMVAAAYGLLKMANWAGVPAIVPSLVPEPDLNTANALESVSFGLADVGGPGIAGALIAVFGAATVLVVDGASYAVFIAFLLRLRIPAPAQDQQAAGSAGSAEATRGLALRPALRFLRRTPPVLATTLMFMAFNVGEGMILVLVPVYARRGLGAGAATYGVMLSTFALAAVVGSAVVGTLRWRGRLGRSIALSQALAGACVAGLAFPPSLPVALGALALARLFASPLTIWAQTLRMRLIPDGMRGRVFGVLRTLMQSTPPIGGAVAGVLLSGGHLATTALAAAAIMSIPGAIGLFSPALRTDGVAAEAPALAYGSASA